MTGSKSSVGDSYLLQPKLLRGQIVDRFLVREGITPNESIEIDDLNAIWALVENGQGAAILPLSKDQTPPTDRIRLLPLEPGGLYRHIGIRHRRRLQAPEELFIEFLQEAVAEWEGGLNDFL